jgi:hypothetical protein
MAIRLSLIERRSTAAPAIILVLLSGLTTERVLAGSDESSTASSLFDSKYTLALGGFFPRVHSTFTLDGPRGGGTEIDVEDDLGLDSDTSSAWVSFDWRFKPRHQLHVEWFQLNRKGSLAAGRSLTIDDTTVGVGSLLESKVDLNLGRVTYGYSIIRKSNLDLSFLIGAHVATAKGTVTAAGNVSVDGVPVVSGSVTESSSTLTFPLPHLGGSLSYEFTPKLAGNLTVLAFALDLGDYSGSLLEVDAMMAYQLSKTFGIGGGLKYFNLNLQANLSGGGNVEYDYNFFGPAIFGYASF